MTSHQYSQQGVRANGAAKFKHVLTGSLIGLAVLASLPAAQAANTTTIAFESPDLLGGLAAGESFIESGYKMTAIDPYGGDGGVGVAQMDGTCALDCPLGNNSHYYLAINDGMLNFARVDGLAFKLNSFDAAFTAPLPQSSPGVSFGRITLTGMSHGVALSTSYELPGQHADNRFYFSNFLVNSGIFAQTAFDSLTIGSCVYIGSGNACAPTDNLAQFSLDNVNVSAVPEPGSWAMLALGLAAIGAVTRRRARQAR
jgi:hypothetical protein